MRSDEAYRPLSPFEALLAASLASSREGETKQNRGVCAPSCGEGSELDSADDTAMGGDYGEGVGESSGRESRDSDNASESSKHCRRKSSKGLKFEGSDSRSGETATSWSAPAPPGKKQRMIWTIELHKRFLNAVNHLGMDNAVPKVILKMMNVDGMTRENVASHLQKYRLHLKRQSSASTSTAGISDAAVALQREDSRHRSASSSPQAQPSGMVKGIPIPQPAAAGSTALGVPLGDVDPLEVSLPLVGASCQHIPPQAWAAGVPGYDALQSLQRMSAQEKALLYLNLSMSRRVTQPAPGPLPQTTVAMLPPPEHSVVLDIAPLTTTSRPPLPPGA